MKQTVLIFSLLITVTGLLAQSHVIEIHANNRVASLLMSEAEYAGWIENDAFNNQSVREALFQDIYKKFDDVFDYIILILNEDEVPSNLVHGQLIHVSNAVQGIGLPLADETSFYGSSGKLTSVDFQPHWGFTGGSTKGSLRAISPILQPPHSQLILPHHLKA